MARGGFDYSQFRQLYDGVKRMEQDSRKFIEDFLTDMALRALAATKRRTPVDVGDLRNSWYLSGVAWRGSDVMINLINPKLYASFVEFGHWQEVGRFVAAIGKRLVSPWVDGRFMMTVSVQEIERQMPQRLEAAWRQYAAGMTGR